MILLIDNYDSFTYNLYQYIGTFNDDIKVVRNDKITIEEIEKMNPERIVISPGPKSPKEAGICLDVIKKFAPAIPILGICLGHQCIGEAFGATIDHAKKIFHGKYMGSGKVCYVYIVPYTGSVRCIVIITEYCYEVTLFVGYLKDNRYKMCFG